MTAPLFHIALRSEWDDARAAGVYEMSTRGVTLADEGFIHCSLSRQVPPVAESFYADLDADDLVVLRIDPALLGATEVRFEPPAPHVTEHFPHLYGPLPVTAVVAELPLLRGEDGTVSPPLV